MITASAPFGQAPDSPPFFSGDPTPFDQQIQTGADGAILRQRMAESKAHKWVDVGMGASITAAVPSSPPLSIEVPGLDSSTTSPPPPPAPSSTPAPTPKPAPPSILDHTGITLIGPLTQ